LTAILDTHAFIWMDSDPGRVPATVIQYLNDPTCTVYLSVVNIWEIVIKVAIGKLVLRADIDMIVSDQLAQTPLQLLPVEYKHVLPVGSLPAIHKDPFDRLLIAQAIAENAVLLTDDPLIRQYPVQTDW
jgi:PIN domain nuclease of toxin-antitoxin system